MTSAETGALRWPPAEIAVTKSLFMRLDCKGTFTLNAPDFAALAVTRDVPLTTSIAMFGAAIPVSVTAVNIVGDGGGTIFGRCGWNEKVHWRTSGSNGTL